MNYDETLSYIHSLGKFRLPASLDRITAVLKMLGDPQNAFKSIHIAGTNGKGSTASMLSNIYIKEGYRVGLFISPFIISFNERIQINGQFISDADLAFYAEKVKACGVELNEFEFITAVCFLYFKDKKVDVAVIETGLGGRLDATNALQNVAASVITKIGLDHTAVLGETIEKITAEKCGIIKKNAPVITVCDQDEKALGVISQKADCLTVAKRPSIIRSTLSGSEFSYKGKNYCLSLLGEHQVYNAATAIETVEKANIKVSELSVYEGLSTAVFPARLEIMSKTPLLILDGAHNPDGARALMRFLDGFEEKITFVCAMMMDKNCREFIRIISEKQGTFIATEIESPRCMKAEDLANIARDHFEKTICQKDVITAIETAKQTKNPIFITGSLYLASKARKIYKK